MAKTAFFLLDVDNQKRIDVDVSADRKFTFGWKSRTYPGYTTWNPGDTRFFAMVKQGEKTRILVGDLKQGNKVELPREDVIGAFWTGDDTLMVVCGKTKPITNDSPDFARFSKQVAFETFDFIPDGASVYLWRAGAADMEKVAKLPGETLQAKIHPLTGSLLCFDGKQVHTFDGKAGFTASDFPYVPDSLQSAISPDGSALFFTHKGEALLGDLLSGKVEKVGPESDLVYHSTFSQDGKYVIYTACSRPSALMFRCMFRVYNVEKKKLVSFVPNFITATLRASTSFPYAFYSDGKLGQIYFDQKQFKKRFFKEPIRKTTMWVIFPRIIKLSSEKAVSDKSATGETPAATGKPSPAIKSPMPAPTTAEPVVTGTPRPFAGRETPAPAAPVVPVSTGFPGESQPSPTASAAP